jgi:hypothetical protein
MIFSSTKGLSVPSVFQIRGAFATMPDASRDGGRALPCSRRSGAASEDPAPVSFGSAHLSLRRPPGA